MSIADCSLVDLFFDNDGAADNATLGVTYPSLDKAYSTRCRIHLIIRHRSIVAAPIYGPGPA